MQPVLKDIWLLGTRIYHGDRFVECVPFEQTAYDYAVNVMHHSSTFTAHLFLSSNSKYTQRVEALEQFGSELSASGEFVGVKLESRPSALGLPWTLVYEHPVTGIRTEFDGLLFVSEKRLHEGDLTPAQALEFAHRCGFSDESGGQIPSAPSPVWNQFSPRTDARCNWRYVTGSMRVAGLCRQQDFDPRHLMFAVKLVDSNIMLLTCLAQNVDVGQDYYILLGNRDYVRQVLAHDSEARRYLRFIGDGVEGLRKEAVEVRQRLFSVSPLLPERFLMTLSPRHWTNSVKYWTKVHRAIEVLNRARLYLGVFPPFVQAYKDSAAAGRGFYDLQDPFLGTEGLSQYPTAPIRAEVEGDWVVVSVPIALVNDYGQLPDPILDLVASTQSLVRETNDMLQSLVSSSELQAVMVTATVSLAAVLLSFAAFVCTVVSICVRR